ncbi:hypothetical protein JTF08_06220 [Micrococcaceae bacterium RIT802]|nr:hypothetical protein [Micrococcaceae bacterium RIT 802]
MKSIPITEDSLPRPEPSKHDIVRNARAEAKKRIRPIAQSMLPVVERLAGSKPGAKQSAKPAPQQSPKASTEPAGALRASLDTGTDYLEPLFADVRQAIADGHSQSVLSSALSPATGTTGDDVSRALEGLAKLEISGYPAAWTAFREIGDETVIGAVAEEYFMTAFREDTRQAAERLRTALKRGSHRTWSAATLLHVAQEAYAAGELDAAAELIGTGLARPRRSMSGQQRREMERLLTWFPDGARRAPQPVADDGINFGLLGYQQPHGWSRNVGDYIQTLASVGHVLRYDNLEFRGDGDLVDFLGRLRDDVKTERKLPGTGAKVNLVEVYRDASTLQDIPPSTWALAFGWFMHPMFGQGANFPFHENLRPLFVSFHVNKPSMLTTEATGYLRKYGPIGCRDWQTVALLRAADVPAFFSGCLTTTVDTVFRRDGADTRTGTVYVDSPVTGEGTVLEQTQPDMLKLSFAEKLETAHQWVRRYHEDYKHIVTSRLHCFLPSRSVGCEVQFLPKNRSDVRFGGLIDTDDAAFNAIRDGILDKLATVLPLVFSGRDETEVYAAWAEACAPAMAEADAFLAQRPGRAVDASILDQVDEASAELRSGQRRDAVQVVIDLAPAERPHLDKLLASVAAATAGPVDVWIVALDAGDWRPSLPEDSHLVVHVITADSPVARSLEPVVPAVSVQAAVLSVMPRVLRQAPRVLQLSGSSMIRGDLTDLLARDLGDAPLASLAEHRKGRTSGFHLMRAISQRHRDDNQRALEFIAVSHAQNGFDFAVADPSVAVFDTGRYVELDLAVRMLELLANYTVDYSDVVNITVGGLRQDLDGTDVYSPLAAAAEEPRIVSWRHTQKPWNNSHVPFAPEWAGL